MTDFEIIHFIWLLASVSIVWIIPQRWQLDAIAASSLLFIAFYSPLSVILLLSSSLLVYLCASVSRSKQMPFIVGAITIITSIFIWSRVMSGSGNLSGATLPSILGLAYYTCRHIHVLMEIYKGTVKQLNLRQYLQYQFFLPVLVAGPINRYHNFLREADRRRWNSANISSSLERILYGYIKIIIIGNFLLNDKLGLLIEGCAVNAQLELLLISAKDWLYLYAVFSGYTDVALGFSLILGIRIEENFNNPLAAKNLINFWQRWHITLSQWCKDYVFSPIQARTRNQLLAVFAAMIAMGVWHQVSLYYFLWGMYHATGIALCRLLQLNNSNVEMVIRSAIIRKILARVATFAWLISSRPVISMVIALIRGDF